MMNNNIKYLSSSNYQSELFVNTITPLPYDQVEDQR